MTTAPPHDLSVTQWIKAHRARLVFIIAVVLIPVWFFVGGFVSRPDARGMADGPEGIWYWPSTGIVLLLSFVGMVCAPFLSRETLGWRITFALVAIEVFVVDVIFSMLAVHLVYDFVD